MISLLFNELSKCGYPVFLQGTYSGAEYPDSFITYIVQTTDDATHYNNDPTSWRWSFSVIFYSKNPELMDSAPDAIRATLKAAGFIPLGKGYHTFSDDPEYTGWITEYLYLET